MLRSQQIACQSLTGIQEASQRDGKFQQRYATLVNRLPIMIRESGLVASLGFLEGKRGNDENTPEGMLLQHLSQQMEVNDLRQQALNAELTEYRHLTQKVMEALVWYKRIAESHLDQEGNTHAD